jgi:WD40 repeat protein
MISANPYIGTRPFRKGEKLYGREREIAKLLDLLVAERIVLMLAPSGAGKTSLIEAGLVPRLESDELGFEVLPTIRVSRQSPSDFDGTPENRYIFSTLLCLEEKLPPALRREFGELSRMTLNTYLHERPQPDDNPHNDFLIFDQFEEILSTDINDDHGRHQFFFELGKALRDHKIWALFAMREEYVAALCPYSRPIPTGLATTFRLDFLDPEHAKEAIQEPAEEAQVTFADDAADELVKNLRGSGKYIEPLHLQIVCRHLWDEKLGRMPRDATARQITLDDVRSQIHGSIDGALEAYYAECVYNASAGAGIAERAIREWIDEHLITAQGIRNQVPRATSDTMAGLSAAIDELVKNILVRVEKRRDIEWLELAHDRLLRPIKSNNAKWYAENLSALQRVAQLWKAHGRDRGLLLQGHAFDDAIKWVKENPNKLDEVELDFYKACWEGRIYRNRERRKNRFIATFAVLALLGLGVAVKFYLDASRSEWLASSRALASQAARFNQPLDLGLLLALEANQDKVFLNERLRKAALETLPLPFAKFEPLSAASNKPLDIWGGLLSALTANTHLLTFLHEHKLPVRSVAFNPDGTMLASAGDDGQILLWRTRDHRDPDKLAAKARTEIYALAFHPSNTLLAAGEKDGTVTLWDLKRRAPIWAVENISAVRSLAFSPDCKWLAMAGRFEEINIWNVGNAGAAPTLEKSLTLPDRSEDAFQTVRALAFSADSRRLAVGISRTEWRNVGYSDAIGRVTVWSTEKWTSFTLPELGKKTINSLAFKPAKADSGGCRSAQQPESSDIGDKAGLALAMSDGEIQLWDMKQQDKAAETLFATGGRASHSPSISAIAFAKADKLVAAGANKQIMVWDVSNPSSVKVWDVINRSPMRFRTGVNIHSINVASDGNTIAAAGDDGSVLLLAVEQSSPHPLAQSVPGTVNGIAWSDQSLVTAHTTAEVKFWETVPELRDVTEQQQRPISQAIVAAATDTNDKRRSLVDSSLTRPISPISRITSSPDGKTLAWFSRETKLVFVDDRTTRKRFEVNSGLADLDSIAVRNDGLLAIGGKGDHEIEVWKKRGDGYEIASSFNLGSVHSRGGKDGGDELTHRKDAVLALAFSPDNKTLASGDSRNAIIVWDLSNGSGKAIEQSLTRDILALAYSRNGTLASGGKDGAIILWDSKLWDSKKHRRLRDHEGPVTALAFSPDSRILASGSEDRRIILWDVSTNRPVATPLQTTAGISGLSFSPDRTRLRLASAGGGDGYIWDLQLESLRQKACRIAARGLTDDEAELYLGGSKPTVVCEKETAQSYTPSRAAAESQR